MNAEEQVAVKNAANELADDVVLAKKLIAESKTKGWKVALTDNAPEIIKELKEDFSAGKAVAPIVKAGYQTSEFWIVAGAIGLIVGANALGKPLPFAESALISGLAAAYAVVRGIVKK